MACTHLYILSVSRGLREGSGPCIFVLSFAGNGLHWINKAILMYVVQTGKAHLGAEMSKFPRYSCNSDEVKSLTVIQTSSVVGYWCMSFAAPNGPQRMR